MSSGKQVCRLIFILALFGAAVGLSKPVLAANIEIEWMVWGRPAEMEFYKRAVAEYEKENSNVKVKLSENPIAEHYKVLDLRMASKTAPDLFRLAWGQMTRYVKADQALDLTSYMPSGFMEGFFPLLRRFVERDGKLLGIPEMTDTNVAFYNRDYLAKTGIVVPTSLDKMWDWKQWGEVGAKVKAANELKFGAISALRTNWPTFFNTLGGYWYDAKRDGPAMDSPGVLEGLKWQKKMYDEKIDSIESMFQGPSDADQLFTLGQVGMIVSGVWMNAWLDQQIGNKFKWGALFVPKGAGGFAATIGGCANLVSKQSKHPKETADFLLWLSSDKMRGEFAQVGFIPPTMRLANSIQYNKYGDIMQLAVKQLAANPVDLLYPEFAHQNHFAMRQAQVDTISLGMLGKISVEESLDRFNKKLIELAK